MIILHYETAIKIKLSLVIIVTWHFDPFSRDTKLELRIVVYGFLTFCEWFCFDVSQFGIAYMMNFVLTLDYQLLLSIKSKN